MRVRRLDPRSDLALVAGLAPRVADYVRLETGDAPGPDWADDFFADAPPGGGPDALVHLGLFKGDRLVGVAALAFGWPESSDAYLGLMLIDAAERGAGLGRHLLDAILAEARARAAPRLLLAVLDANPRARAFWDRAGFRTVLTLPEAAIGRRRHVQHRMEYRLDDIDAPGS